MEHENVLFFCYYIFEIHFQTALVETFPTQQPTTNKRIKILPPTHPRRADGVPFGGHVLASQQHRRIKGKERERDRDRSKVRKTKREEKGGTGHGVFEDAYTGGVGMGCGA